MQTVANYVFVVFGIYFTIIAFLMNTKNFISAFIFQVMPGLAGVFMLIYSFKSFGIL
jgi:hypothetical protein